MSQRLSRVTDSLYVTTSLSLQSCYSQLESFISYYTFFFFSTSFFFGTCRSNTTPFPTTQVSVYALSAAIRQ
jgi:hypothetical protein